MDARKRSRQVANCPVKEPYRSMSRSAMACWFMPHTGTSHNIEELSTGVIYSRLLAQLFPDCLSTKKLKTGAKLTEREKLHNWKVFQVGLMNIKLDKEVDIEQMIKPTSVSSFEFCRWFIAFHSHHSGRAVLDPQAMWHLPTPRPRMPPTPHRLMPTRRPRIVPSLLSTVAKDEDVTQRSVACSPIRILLEEEEEQRPLAQRTPVRFQVPDTTTSVGCLTHRLERPRIFDLPDMDVFEPNEDTDTLNLSPILADEDSEEEDPIPEEETMLSAIETQVATDESEGEEKEGEQIQPVVPRTPRTPRWKVDIEWDMTLRSSSKKKKIKKEDDDEEPHM